MGDKIFVAMGASNHSEKERQTEDYYATEPKAVDCLIEETDLVFNKNIWEPASGGNHIADKLRGYGFDVRTSDIIKRCDDTEILDFLTSNEKWHGDIITNPPYKIAQKFAEKALESVEEGAKVAMFLKVLFLESKGRKEFFKKYPPKYVFISSGRLNCAMNGDFRTYKSSAIAYAWYVWEKGFQGDPIIKWIN